MRGYLKEELNKEGISIRLYIGTFKVMLRAAGRACDREGRLDGMVSAAGRSCECFGQAATGWAEA